MKAKIPYVVRFNNRKDEVFEDYASLKKHIDLLWQSEKIAINFLINSSEEHAYYESAHDFYAKINSLRQSGKKFVILTRNSPLEPFMTSNMRKKLNKTTQ